jgi:hypothetical protein
LQAVQAAPGELVMLAPLDQTMPVVRFQNGVLAGGIVKDLGDALAQRLGRRAVYLSVDVYGVTPALTSGKADAMCYVSPSWIDGEYDWSVPMLPDAEMVVAQADAPHLNSLKDLRDKPTGTVAGYRYPRVEQVLGRRFARVDAPNMQANLHNMLAAKTPYTMASENILNYMQRTRSSSCADLCFSPTKPSAHSRAKPRCHLPKPAAPSMDCCTMASWTRSSHVTANIVATACAALTPLASAPP